MEPTDGLDPSGAMIEMICLFIAALGCMTTILPCCRAFVLQCSSPPTMASSRFPLACLLLLTAVFAPLASALTFPKLPALLVPPAMPLPLASCCSTPHVPLACNLPCSETFQGGGARVQELHGTSTCSFRESWDSKHAAEFEAPLNVPVWDDLPHSSPHDITPPPPAPAGPCLSFPGLCTTECCSSLGPEQPTQASCVPCAGHTCIAALCKTPRMPTLPSILYENETYYQPSDNLWPYPSRSPVHVGVLEFESFRHGTLLRALGLLMWPTLLVAATVLLLWPSYHARKTPCLSPAAMRLLLLAAVLSCLVPVAEGAGVESTQDRHARRIRSMGMEAAMAAFTTAFGLAALRSCFADYADHAACSPSCVGAAAPVSEGAAIAHDASAALIAAAWRACRQSHAARAAARLAAALSEASHSARSAPLAQVTGAYTPPPHRTAAAQVLIRSWRAIAARRRASTGCALLRAVCRSTLQPAQVHCSDTPTRFGPSPVVIASTAPFTSVGAAGLGATPQLQSPLPPGLGLTGSAVHPGATTEALAAREELRRSADDGSYVPFDEPAWLQQAVAAEARQRDRRTLRSVAFGLQTSRQREAGALLASVRPHTWCILAFCLRLRRRAEQRAIAQLHSRLLQCPQCARFVACLRARVLRRAAALELLSSPPRPLLHDVGYDDDSGFRFRDVRGVVTVQHPAFTATAGTIPAYSPDGSVVLPVSPPSTSMVVLRPEASGAWCYCDTASGTASWYPPDGSTSLVARLFPEVPPVSEERPPRIPSQVGLNSLTYTGWAPIFRDGTHEVFLVHQQTGAVRSAPWIALRTRDGRAYFANLLTRETRWLPPHLWMQGWVSRLEIDSASPASADIGSMSQALSSGGRDLPCDCRRPLPTLVGRQRVEGGAPYMYEPTLGVPQYPPDERWDSQLTYPLEGNYVRWPRASTPDRRQVPLRSTGWERELPGSHEVCHRLWLTIAAADAADAREASKPHRASDAVRQPSGTYTGEPGDRLQMTSSALYFSGPGEALSFSEEPEEYWFPEVVELDRPRPSADDWPAQSDGLGPLERQEVEDEAEYWRMHREAELREMQLDEADYWRAAASHEEMLEKQHELEVEQAIETSRCLPPPSIYLQAERSRSRPTSSPTAPATLAARCAPLLPPRFADHALLLRAVSVIQRAWFWHAHRCWLPGFDASTYVAVTPSGTRLAASGERIRRGPTERTWNAVLHAVGRGGDFFLLTPPPFRFVIQPPSDDPIDNGVLPGRAGLLGEYLYF